MNQEPTLSPEAIHLLTKDQAWHYRILPKEKSLKGIMLYCEEGINESNLISELEILIGLKIQLDPISPTIIAKLLSKYYLKESGIQGKDHIQMDHNADDFLVNLIAEAKNLKSSDIHIETYKNKSRVRIRIDGTMVERYIIKRDDYPALINKIKILSDLDISEKRLPQDGRINFKLKEDEFDIRVSILPTLHGEKVALRLLNHDATDIDLNSLGFSAFDLENYMEGVMRTSGILLISGPTGSGKTTTLYATLKLLNKVSRHILTVEDPVEYTLEGINQVQLKESIGLGFATTLRTFLRQDPNVIMVGEIRDTETANMAIRLSLTGHLVLSTIHTNSAWGTVSRLMDMGIPPFLVANTLNTSVAQRLIRLLCPHCKREEAFNKSLFPKQFIPYFSVEKHFKLVGCEECFYTGFKGRKAVYEVIPIDRDLAAEIKNGNLYVAEALKERGIRSIAENAFSIFASGMTSLEEIYPLLLNY